MQKEKVFKKVKRSVRLPEEEVAVFWLKEMNNGAIEGVFGYLNDSGDIETVDSIYYTNDFTHWLEEVEIDIN